VAVYERSYRSYAGPLTEPRWRFMVLPRYAVRDVFTSKLFIGFLVLCFLAPLVLSVMIYVPHNSTFLKTIETMSGNEFTLKIGVNGYFWYMVAQGFLAFWMAFILGPALISADLRNNALPLYLARPFSRAEYILGKTVVLNLLLSTITWIPGLVLFLLQSYLEGFTWFSDNLRIPTAVFFSSVIWIVLLCLISLALSAYVKWRPVARLAYIGLFIVLSAVAGIVNFLFKTDLGSLLNIGDMIGVIWATLFGITSLTDVPAWSAWMSILTFSGLCLLLLARKVKAYEVVKS